MRKITIAFRLWVAILGLTFVFALAALPAVRAQETPEGIITFLFGDGSRPADLYLMDTNGQNVRRVASGVTAGNGSYSLSTDGKRVVYYHASHELRILDLETGEERTVFKQASDSTVNLLSWAPDGQQFTFATTVSAPEEGIVAIVMSMDAATGHQAPLFSYLNQPADNINAVNAVTWIRWTPDGRQLIYQIDNRQNGEPYSAVEAIRQTNLDGSGDTPVYQFSTNDINSTHLWLKLSPDGQFVLQDTNMSEEVEIVDLNGSRIRRVTEPRQPIEARGSGNEYTWMPDGEAIFSIAIGVQGDQAAVGQFILRKFDIQQGQWTDIISGGDSGRAPRCGTSTCIRDIRWYTPTAALDPIVIETLPPADDQTVWDFDAGLDGWTGYVDNPWEDKIDEEDGWRPASSLNLSGLEALSSDNDRPDAWIMRSVQIPAGATKITLIAGGIELGAKLANSEFITEEMANLRVLVRDEALNWHTILDWQPIDGLEWLTFEADLSAFAGQTVTLSVEQDGPMPVYLDQVAIE